MITAGDYGDVLESMYRILGDEFTRDQFQTFLKRTARLVTKDEWKMKDVEPNRFYIQYFRENPVAFALMDIDRNEEDTEEESRLIYGIDFGQDEGTVWFDTAIERDKVLNKHLTSIPENIRILGCIRNKYIELVDDLGPISRKEVPGSLDIKYYETLLSGAWPKSLLWNGIANNGYREIFAKTLFVPSIGLREKFVFKESTASIVWRSDTDYGSLDESIIHWNSWSTNRSEPILEIWELPLTFGTQFIKSLNYPEGLQ